MTTGKHYVIEQNSQRKFTVRADGTETLSATFTTLREAIEHVKKLNPDDNPGVRTGTQG